MWATIIAKALNFFGGTIFQSILNDALDAYKAKISEDTSVAAMKDQIAVAELQLQTTQEQLQEQYKVATLGRWYEPDHVMAYTVAIYLAKILVWDKVLHMGTTDPLTGWSAIMASMVGTYYFGKRGFENVLAIWKLKG